MGKGGKRRRGMANLECPHLGRDRPGEAARELHLGVLPLGEAHHHAARPVTQTLGDAQVPKENDLAGKGVGLGFNGE